MLLWEFYEREADMSIRELLDRIEPFKLYRERMVIHTSERVTSRAYVRLLSMHEVQDNDPGIAPGVKDELGRLLITIPGVAAVLFQPYELDVRERSAVAGHDLRPSLVDSMRQVCSPFT
jgi:hypothetical protein